MSNKLALAVVAIFEGIAHALPLLNGTDSGRPRPAQGIVRAEDWYLVTNVDDFEIHVNAHVTRVRLLGLEIAKRFFPQLNQDLLSDYLSLHDAEKLIDTPEFRNLMGLNADSRRLLENLFEHFGSRRRVRQKSELEQFEAIRQKLNEIGGRISREWLTQNGHWNSRDNVATADGKLFVLIEHVADVLDCELDPIAFHELGKTMFEIVDEPNSADKYVESFQELRILREMRPFYAQIVEGNTYRDWVRRERIHIKMGGRSACLTSLRKLFATL